MPVVIHRSEQPGGDGGDAEDRDAARQSSQQHADENSQRQIGGCEAARPDHDAAKSHQGMHQRAGHQKQERLHEAAAQGPFQGEHRERHADDARREELLVDGEDVEAAVGKRCGDEVNKRQRRDHPILNQATNQAEQGENEQRVANEIAEEEDRLDAEERDQWADQAREERELILGAKTQEDVGGIGTVLRLIEGLQAVQAAIMGGGVAGAGDGVDRQQQAKQRPGPIRQFANGIGRTHQPGWQGDRHTGRLVGE